MSYQCHKNSFRRYQIFFFCMSTFILGLFTCCNNKTYNTPKEYKQLHAIGDSIKNNSPHARYLVILGMKQAKDSLEYYSYLIQLTKFYYLNSKPDSMSSCLKRIFQYTKTYKEKDTRIYDIIGQAYEIKADTFFMTIKSDSAIKYHTLAYNFIMKSPNLKGAPNLCANLADAYSQKNKIPEAAHWYRRALFLSDSLNLPHSSYVSLYMGLAQIYMTLHDYKTADYYYKSTEKVYKQLTPNLKNYFLNNYGNFLYYKKDYPNSLKIFRRLRLMLQNSKHLETDINICQLNLADVFLNLGQIDSARYYLTLSEPYFKRGKITDGEYYINTIKIGIALTTNNIKLVHHILNSETFTPPARSNLAQIRDSYLRNYYLKIGNYKKAYNNLLSITHINDSIENSRQHMKAGEIMMRYQQDTLDLHHKLVIAKKDSEVKKANFFVMIALTISLFIALAASIYMAYSRKIKLQTQMKMLELRLTSIRNRISPHFIFNVLNHENENNHLEMNQLTQLLRESIDLSYLNAISLATELDFVSKYIELEKHVMGNDFEFKIIAPTHTIMEHIIIPPMLIQILVENSIKHGLKGLEGHKKLIIEIQALVNGTNIYVRDNGRGFYIQTENSRTKTGLNIIRQSMLINNQRNKQKMEFKIHNIVENDKIIGCEAFIHIPNNLKLADSINN